MQIADSARRDLWADASGRAITFSSRLANVVHTRGFIAGITIAGTLLLLHLLNPQVGGLYGAYESHMYVRTVESPLAEPVDPQYGYRLLPALIVRLLPVSYPTGFIVTGYVSLFIAGFLLVSILRYEGIRTDLALLAAVLFLTFRCSTKWMLAYSAGVDAFHLMLIAMAYRCIQLQRWRLLSLAFVLGVFTKVTIWVLWPVALVYGACHLPGTGPKRFASIRVRAATIVPSLMVFLAVRMVWPADPANHAYRPEYTYLLDILYNLKLRCFRTSELLPGILPQCFEFPMAFLVVFGLVAIILLFFATQSLSHLARHPAMAIFLAGTTLTSIIGSYGSARPQLYAFVPILFVFAAVIQTHWDFFRRWYVFMPLIAVHAYLSNIFFFDVDDLSAYMPHYMPPTTAVYYLPAWTIAVILLAGLWFLYTWQTREHDSTRRSEATGKCNASVSPA